MVQASACAADAGGTPAPQDDGLSRRRWLQLMGASLALAGAGGCRWEKTELLPFAKRPPGRTPGKVENSPRRWNWAVRPWD